MYDCVGDFHEGFADVEFNGKRQLIDSTGKEFIKYGNQYNEIYDFYEDIALVINNHSKYGYIDRQGKKVIKCMYDFADSFQGGIARVCLNDKWSFIDRTGKKVIEYKYDHICDFSEGLARVKLNDKYGFIDKTGKEVIECKYDDASDFHDGLARVKLNDKWGFIDKTGKEVDFNSFTTKIPLNSFNSSDLEELKAISEKIKNAKSVNQYYDLIIDNNRISFSTLEEREQFEKELFIEEDSEKQYTLSKK